MVDKIRNFIAPPLRRRIIIVAAVVLPLICVGIILTFALRGRMQDIFTPTQQTMRVYFFNPQAGELQAENIPITQDFNWVLTAFENMQHPPGRNLSSTWPETILPPVYAHHQQTVFLTFDDAYLQLSAFDEALFRSALTLTLTAWPYIDEVIFRIGDNYRGESNATVFNAPMLSPARLANVSVVLYFVCENGDGLIRDYAIVRDANPRETELVALERLIAGPVPEGATSLLPAETRVRILRDVETRSIYVNLSGEFAARFSGGSAQAQFAVQSIVNTVLSNSVWDIRQVFFLIDSARESQFHGVQDFDRGFEYDESVMVGFVVEEE